jgi:hypothetical protein
MGFLGVLVWSWFSPYASLIRLDAIWLSQPMRERLASLAVYFSATMQGAVAFAVVYFLVSKNPRIACEELWDDGAD